MSLQLRRKWGIIADGGNHGCVSQMCTWSKQKKHLSDLFPCYLSLWFDDEK